LLQKLHDICDIILKIPNKEAEQQEIDRKRKEYEEFKASMNRLTTILECRTRIRIAET